MKKLILILGNGLTMDLLARLDTKKDNIDLSNLFSKGDTVVWPDGKHERGFLSYKHCPSLWNLGARPNMDKTAATELIEDIITCANMVSSANAIPQENNIYLTAYYELVAYLKHLFIQYNEQVSDRDLLSEKLDGWGWLQLIKSAYHSEEYDSHASGFADGHTKGLLKGLGIGGAIVGAIVGGIYFGKKVVDKNKARVEEKRKMEEEAQKAKEILVDDISEPCDEVK